MENQIQSVKSLSGAGRKPEKKQQEPKQQAEGKVHSIRQWLTN